MVASFGSPNGGTSFNGYSQGALVISVPAHWKVILTCQSKGPLNHSCVVVNNVHLNERLARLQPPTDSIDQLTAHLARFDCPVRPFEHDVLLPADVAAERGLPGPPRIVAKPLYLTAIEELSYPEAGDSCGAFMFCLYRVRRRLLAS